MIIPHYLAGRTVVVLGLGKTGLTVCRALQAAACKVIAWDDDVQQLHAARDLGVAVEDVRARRWHVGEYLLVSPGIPWRWPQPHPAIVCARQAGVTVLSDADVFAISLRYAASSARLVGITGTNGKSTTTSLIGHILHYAKIPSYVGGNLGLSPFEFDLLETGTYVLEMSSYNLDLSRHLFLDVGVLLNISPDHLNRHGGMEGYVAAKRLIFEGPIAKGYGIISVDDPHCAQIYEGLNPIMGERLIPISVERPLAYGLYLEEGKFIDNTCGHARLIGGCLANLSVLKGQHNWQNIMAAYGATRALGLPSEMILNAIRTFPGLAHRQQVVNIIDDVVFINDSKGTNADATARALACYENIYWIAGGRSKEGGISSLQPFFQKIKHAYLIGEAAEDFARTLAEARVPFSRCHTLDRAVTEAYALARQAADPQAVVLLSPACASQDQFQHFEHRGEVFQALVNALIDNER